MGVKGEEYIPLHKHALPKPAPPKPDHSIKPDALPWSPPAMPPAMPPHLPWPPPPLKILPKKLRTRHASPASVPACHTKILEI